MRSLVLALAIPFLRLYGGELPADYNPHSPDALPFPQLDIMIDDYRYDAHGVEVWFTSSYSEDHVVAVYPIHHGDFHQRHRPLGWTVTSGRHARVDGNFIKYGNSFVQVFHHSITNRQHYWMYDKSKPLSWKRELVTNVVSKTEGGYLEGGSGSMLFLRWADITAAAAAKHGSYDPARVVSVQADILATGPAGTANWFYGAADAKTTTASVIQGFGETAAADRRCAYKSGKATDADTVYNHVSPSYRWHEYEFGIGGSAPLCDYHRVERGSFGPGTASNAKVNANAGLGFMSIPLNDASGAPTVKLAGTGSRVKEVRVVYCGERLLTFVPTPDGTLTDTASGLKMDKVAGSGIAYVPAVTTVTTNITWQNIPTDWARRPLFGPDYGKWNPCLTEEDRKNETDVRFDFANIHHDGFFTKNPRNTNVQLLDGWLYRGRSNEAIMFRGFGSFPADPEGRRVGLDYYGSIGIIKDK